MKKSSTIILSFLLLFGTLTANAQFNKPLQSASMKRQSANASYNIGIIGGASITQWIHFGGTGTQYNEPIGKCIGYLGGVSIEKMLNDNLSVGIEGMYAIRNLYLTYEIKQFPVGLYEWNDISKTLDANYNEICVQVPLCFYMTGTTASSIRPYMFAGPRMTIIQDGGSTTWHKTNLTTNVTENDTVGINKSNFQPFNIGITAGIGALFKINLPNYYFLMKLDASCHAGLINTFSEKEKEGSVETVIGADYIDPYLLGKRFSGNADLRLTILFPLKKLTKGACISWGEYD